MLKSVPQRCHSAGAGGLEPVIRIWWFSGMNCYTSEMNRRALFLAATAGAAMLNAQAPKPLEKGAKAPDFKLRSTHNTTVSLADHAGKDTVVLAFFPAAFTGGCTKEMKAYQTEIAKFEAAGAKVYGISTDNLPSQAYWAKEVLKVEVPILSDFMKKVSADYGVLNPQIGIANRTTFVIAPDGTIADVILGAQAIDPALSLASCSRIKK